jgi:hypothetical protein
VDDTYNLLVATTCDIPANTQLLAKYGGSDWRNRGGHPALTMPKVCVQCHKEKPPDKFTKDQILRVKGKCTSCETKSCRVCHKELNATHWSRNQFQKWSGTGACEGCIRRPPTHKSCLECKLLLDRISFSKRQWKFGSGLGLCHKCSNGTILLKPQAAANQYKLEKQELERGVVRAKEENNRLLKLIDDEKKRNEVLVQTLQKQLQQARADCKQ